MNITRSILCIVLAAFFVCTGCTFLAHPINQTFARHSNPIADWHFCSLDNLDKNKAVSDDYHDYINKLPPKKRKSVGGIHYFEDGTGQHAVSIEVSLGGTEWEHVLIYDRNDKRVRVVKYVAAYYSEW